MPLSKKKTIFLFEWGNIWKNILFVYDEISTSYKTFTKYHEEGKSFHNPDKANRKFRVLITINESTDIKFHSTPPRTS